MAETITNLVVNEPREKIRNRSKKVISLPNEYWDILKKRQNGALIGTYGDAIIDIIDILYKNNLLGKT
ncbi:MAG: hypothetical protein PHE88_12545 [Elusimicrobia bacterium]|nr:hypothetical protein [Elusimicrobiota bacterium]